MAELLDSALSYSGDKARMAELQQSCGLESVEVASSAYRTTVDLVMEELAKLADRPQSARSLLGMARSMEQSEQRDPTMYFKSTDDSWSDDLIAEVFGPDAAVVVDAVEVATGITSTKARSLAEAATGVILSIAAGEPGEAVTLDSLTKPIRNEGPAAAAGSLLAAAAAPEASGSQAKGPEIVASETAVPAHATEIPMVDSPQGSGRSKAWMLAPVGVAALIGLGLFVATRDDDQSSESIAIADETSASEDAEPDEAVDVEEADPIAAESETVSGSEDTDTDESATDDTASSSNRVGLDESEDAGSDETESASDPAPEGATEVVSPPAPPGAPENYSILSGGKIFLRGKVPSTEVEAAIVAAVTQILGPGNVISEYEIDPDDPFEEGREAVVFVDETVLFATGSTEIAQDFLPVLGLGLALLQLQEGVQLEVTGHTDSLGGAAENLALSQARVDAVKAFFVSQGIDADRVVATGKGETEPRADNSTPEGRQANRRVEFIVEGFSF